MHPEPARLHRTLIALVAAALPALAAAAPPPDAAGEALRQRLDDLQATGRLEAGGETLVSRTLLPLVYEAGGYQPLWDRARLDALLGLVRAAGEDGLTPDDYHLAALLRLAPRLEPGTGALPRAQLDLLATDAYILLLYHLYVGKVDPVSIEPTWNFPLRAIVEQDAARFVADAIARGRLREAVDTVRPRHFFYQRGRAALAAARAAAAAGGWPAVPGGAALRPGTNDPRVPALRRRLAATGELAGQPLDSTAFDEPLAAAVRAFQAGHRLEADGAVGAGTVAELNVSAAARVDQVRANLERARWVLHDLTGSELVIVDVAGFELRYFRDEQEVWQGRVQVGKPYRQTPIFRSAIDHLVFNPTWTVPPTILKQDILPAVRRDPGYLAKRKLEVIDRDGNTVDPSRLDWSRYTGGNFPYLLRQGPGPDNALGRVKIMFPNPHAVYLHDTPHRELFGKVERAFSSGCIRVERPLELAALLLDDPQAWNAQSIDAVIRGEKTRTVRLPKPVPVLIMYWTIDLRTPGTVAWKRDPYGRDPRLLRALDAPFRAGSRPAP